MMLTCLLSSMTLCSMMARNTSASPHFPACGTAPSPSSLRAVSLLLISVTSRTNSRYRPKSEMFAATGWRIGWLIGPSWIIQPTLAATTRIVFCSNSPMQEAVAAGLEQVVKRGFAEKQCQEYLERRNILAQGFDKLGMRYTMPEGTYFLLLVSEIYHAAMCTLLERYSTGYLESEMARGLPFPTERPR